MGNAVQAGLTNYVAGFVVQHQPGRSSGRRDRSGQEIHSRRAGSGPVRIGGPQRRARPAASGRAWAAARRGDGDRGRPEGRPALRGLRQRCRDPRRRLRRHPAGGRHGPRLWPADPPHRPCPARRPRHGRMGRSLRRRGDAGLSSGRGGGVQDRRGDRPPPLSDRVPRNGHLRHLRRRGRRRLAAAARCRGDGPRAVGRRQPVRRVARRISAR